MYKRDGVETKERADERRTAAPRRRRDDLLAAVIAHRQIAVVFQPQINPSTGAVEGAEALARWDRVAGAEELFERAAAAGLSERLSRLVQSKALRAAAAWEGPLRRLRISINLLPDEILHEGFVEWLLDEVTALGIDPKRVTVEITENVLPALLAWWVSAIPPALPPRDRRYRPERSGSQHVRLTHAGTTRCFRRMETECSHRTGFDVGSAISGTLRFWARVGTAMSPLQV